MLLGSVAVSGLSRGCTELNKTSVGRRWLRETARGLGNGVRLEQTVLPLSVYRTLEMDSEQAV